MRGLPHRLGLRARQRVHRFRLQRRQRACRTAPSVATAASRRVAPTARRRRPFATLRGWPILSREKRIRNDVQCDRVLAGGHPLRRQRGNVLPHWTAPGRSRAEPTAARRSNPATRARVAIRSARRANGCATTAGSISASDAGASRARCSAAAAQAKCVTRTRGACLPKVCDPGKLGCDSTRVVTCNSAGSGWNQSGPDCAANGSSCSGGACLPITCTAGQTFCKDNKVTRCSGDGTSSSISQDCGQFQGLHCAALYGYAQCAPLTCTPNSLGCNGNVLATCNADGTDWAAGGTDCTVTNATCMGTKCEPMVCKPSLLFCSSGNVQQCDEQGLTFYQQQYCASGTVCTSVTGGSAECDPTPCSADTDGCVGEKFGHCAQDGMSVGGTVTDCGATSKVCTAQGCAASARDHALDREPSRHRRRRGSTDQHRARAHRAQADDDRGISLAAERALADLGGVRGNQRQPEVEASSTLAYQKTTPGSAAPRIPESSGAISFEYLKAGKTQTYAIGVSAHRWRLLRLLLRHE